MSKGSVRIVEGDLNRLLVRMNNAGKIAKQGGDKAIDDLALDVAQGAIDRAPRLTGSLEQAVDIETTDTGKRHTAEVFIDLEVAPHAVYMHEGIEGGEPPAGYELGEISQSKNTGTPHVGRGVGFKFLERSFEQNYRAGLKRVNDALKAAIARSGE